MSSLRQKRKKHGINILPLLDVLTVILFFFLMTMQFRQTRTMNLVLPEIQTAGSNQFTDKIVLSVDQEGQLFYNNALTTSEEFSRLLETAARDTTSSPVLIHADEETHLKKITWIMDQCRANGFRKIRIQSR